MAIPPWLGVMRSLDGTHATGDNPTILGWAKFIAQQYPDMASYCAGYTHDSISWCGLTIAYCMARSGIRPVFGADDESRFLWALAWKGFGGVVNEDDEQPGDVLVFVWASGGHHVTLYEGKDSRGFYICHGGNQSHAVNQQHYSPSYCVGIRRPQAVAAQPAMVPSVFSPALAPAATPLAPLTGLPPILAPGTWKRQLISDAALAALDAEIAALQTFRAGLVALAGGAAPVASPPVTLPASGPVGLPLPDFLQPHATPVPAPSSSSAADRFTPCVTLTLKWEGGNDDDPRDPGGRTSRGITQSEWDKWRQAHPGLPSDVWQAPQDQVLAIYKANYWDVLQCGSLPAGVDYAVFDYGVNSGNSRSAKALQGLVGAPVDGEIGPQTLAATAQVGSAGLVTGICDQRLGFLKSLSTWPTFGRGWTNRVQGVRKDALAMVAAVPTGTATTGAMAMSDSSGNTFFSDPVMAVLGGLVRHGLTTAGGILASKGYLESSMLPEFVGGGMVLAGAAWSWWQKQGQAQAAALLKKLTHANSTSAAVAVAQTLPAGSAVTRGLP